MFIFFLFKYFSEYLPAFFGFNQINTFVESTKQFFANIKKLKRFTISDKFKYELEDTENFIKYFGYGYTKFNYYHCYPKNYPIKENAKKIEYELIEKKELLNSKYFDNNKFKEYSDKLPKIEKAYEKNHKELESNKNLFKELYEPKIKEYCENNKIGIIQKYQDIIDVLTHQEKEKIIMKKHHTQ